MLRPSITVCDICGRDMEKSDDRTHTFPPMHREYIVKYEMTNDGYLPTRRSKRKLDICGNCWDRLKVWVRRNERANNEQLYD